MATQAFINAQIFYAGYEFTSQMNRVDLTLEVEALDNTVFGQTTRTRTGGLKNARATAAGFWTAGAGSVDDVGFNSVNLEDAVFMLFPEGITEGSTSTGAGAMFKVSESRYTFGGAVGELLPFTLDVMGRGVIA